MPLVAVKPLPPPSDEKRIQRTVWFDPVLFKALQHEAIDRDMSVSALIEEALRRRVVSFTEHSDSGPNKP